MPGALKIYVEGVGYVAVGGVGPAGADSTVPGPNGPAGADGATGPAGADSTVPGPQGEPGPAGADGGPGAVGPAGADSTVPGPQGEQGPQGVPGDPGPAGVAGADGADGADGPSAYQVAVADGFVGTEAAWLESLIGPEGPAPELAGLVEASTVRTSGDLSLTSTTWADVDNDLDLVIPAEAGDVLLLGMNAVAANANVSVWFDAHTIVAGTPVNATFFRAAPTPDAYPGGGYATSWFAMGGEYDSIGPPFTYPVQAGDISGGNVRLRLRAIENIATARVVRANPSNPLRFWVVNLTRSTAVGADGVVAAPFVIESTEATMLPLTVKGAVGQTANLVEWVNSDDEVVAAVSAEGELYLADGTGGSATFSLGSGRATIDGVPIALERLGEAVSGTDVSGTFALDAAAFPVYDLQLVGACTFTLSNPAPGDWTLRAYTVTLKLRNGATAYAATFPSKVKWAGGTAPALSGANKADIFSFTTFDRGDTWAGFATQNFSGLG